MGAGQAGQVVTAVVVHNDLLPVALLQHLLAFFGCGQVRQTCFALLQSLAIESIAAVHVNSALDMTHIVGDKRAAIEKQKIVFGSVLFTALIA